MTVNLNFMLTEIALQLLDNKFYDCHGRGTDNLNDLFCNVTYQPPPKGETAYQELSRSGGDLLSEVGVSELIDPLADPERYTTSQFNNMIRLQKHRLRKMVKLPGLLPIANRFEMDTCDMRIAVHQSFNRISKGARKHLKQQIHGPSKDTKLLNRMQYLEKQTKELLTDFNNLLTFLKILLRDVENPELLEHIVKVIEDGKRSLGQ